LPVVWRARALADIGRIVRHIATDNPVAARRVGRELLLAGDSLVMFPRRGRPGRQPGTRELVIMPRYIVVYRITGADTVTHPARLARRPEPPNRLFLAADPACLPPSRRPTSRQWILPIGPRACRLDFSGKRLNALGKSPPVRWRCVGLENLAERRGRADWEAFDRLMQRNGGEPPRPGDELPED
jgi:plasmid stabilization system protein ParE